MADYAIGDIQGCYDSLFALLHQIGFDKRRDRLWLPGDLVNRGPKSLDVLRWARGLGDRAIIVLGNHDLHLLAVESGATPPRAKDTFDNVLSAPDRDELIAWLRERPLIAVEGDVAIVHAGLLPAWTIDRALELAGEAESAIHSDECEQILARFRDSDAPTWRDDLEGLARQSAILAAFTRLRACTADGEMSEYAGPPDSCPEGFLPWYAHEHRASRDHTILFGHWAAHGFYEGHNVCALDSGCVWGNRLTALRLADRAVFQQRAID